MRVGRSRSDWPASVRPGTCGAATTARPAAGPRRGAGRRTTDRRTATIRAHAGRRVRSPFSVSPSSARSCPVRRGGSQQLLQPRGRCAGVRWGGFRRLKWCVVSSGARRVALVTLGCARNEVDSEELAARLGAGDWQLTDESDAEVLVVNTCGFVDAAKKDSIDTVLAAADTGKKVVAVGCLAERYGAELAASLPEADAVLGFDNYADIAARLDDVLAGHAVPVHVPRDRRTLLPITPAHRPAAAAAVAVPGHAWLPSGTARTRLDDGATAYLKIASGCDRRCSFCAIPSFRGAYVSRPPADVLAAARWLASTGVRELV